MYARNAVIARAIVAPMTMPAMIPPDSLSLFAGGGVDVDGAVALGSVEVVLEVDR